MVNLLDVLKSYLSTNKNVVILDEEKIKSWKSKSFYGSNAQIWDKVIWILLYPYEKWAEEEKEGKGLGERIPVTVYPLFEKEFEKFCEEYELEGHYRESKFPTTIEEQSNQPFVRVVKKGVRPILKNL